ncbi:ribosome maturation factor RimM [Parvularcula sp. LCG005]|uniref:ribosome maturation factor RimM n=1 Tax=Parvularcula sp. LCG005 TaxID=3078805 RepID=UPI0029424E7B|nr:ribosome maturation factor RimM [Parvularcula sp. LCG005]WOI53287.1 ribosome maturation factor RimM [Parvularcula sp. LCG005]
MASTKPSPADPLIVVGQFAGPHGVRGDFKIRSFTADPAAIGDYGPLTDAQGRTLTVRVGQEVKPGLFIVRAPEIRTREDCDAYSGTLLHVRRSVLPPADEDEFYLTDLEGLAAFTESGDSAGKVRAAVNYGAGDILELVDVPDRKGPVMVPFTREAVPHVDLAAGRVTVILPDDNDDQPPEDEMRG